MAAASSDGPHASETEEVHDENSGKKKSKFQAFKKFFVKKKRKERPTQSIETSLKPSQSSSDVSVSADSMAALQPAGDPGTKSHMGNKALSHDSVFISEPENTKDCSSQENIPGKVKSLQLQLEQNMRIGSPPRGIIPKNVEDSGALSEDDGLPRSPPEISCLHELSKSVQRRSSLGLGGTDSEDEQGSSRPLSPFPRVLSCPTSPASHSILVDFTASANSRLCLDNSAAKHKIAVKPKNQRGPTGRLKQNVSEQPKESGVAHTANVITEPELDSENAKSTEDVDKTLPVVDVKPLPELPEPEVGQNTCEDGVLFVPVTLEFNNVETKDRQVPSREEHVKGEDDVHLRFSPEPKGDGMDYPIGAAEKSEGNPPLSDNIFNSSLLQEDVITDLVELPRIVHVETGVTVCDVSKECIITGSSENISITEVIESTSCVSEGEDQSPQEQSVTASSDIRSESAENIGRTLVIEETPLPDGVVFDLESPSVPCSSAKPTEDEDASGTITSSEVLESPETLECAETIVCEDHKPSDHLNTVKSINTQGPADLESTSDVDQIHHGIAEGRKAHEVHVFINSVTENQTNESCPAKVPNGAVGKPLEVLPNTDPLMNTCDEFNPTETNIEGKPKSTAKPVRFTVAPAWQRSFSIKRNILKSGSFDEEAVVTLNKDASRNTETAKKGDELIVPFGIRLRSTSTPVKYSEDPFGDSIKVCPVDILSVDLNPNSLTLTPTSQVPLDEAKTSENPTLLKAKVDDPSPRESAGPDWISMAKQKRKGFQEHLRVREPGVSAEKEKSPAPSSLKMNTDSSPHIAEAKKKTELSSLDVPAAPREIQPVTEQSTSQTPSQNPNEPPWLSLAKKKAKAWSEMPHIAQ